MIEPEIIEPNPLLIEYYSIAKSLFTDFDDKRPEFSDQQEWHYILSNIEQNIFLLKRLEEKELLRQSNKIVDCGLGLGTSLYDLYLQSKEITNRKFEFVGIEKNKHYIEYFRKNLINRWNNEILLIEDDISNQNYSEYDVIYTYTPYRVINRLKSFYQKVADEMKPGSLLIENKSSGLGLHGVLTEISGLRKIGIDEIVVFQKI
jgi:hypothetical protein